MLTRSSLVRHGGRVRTSAVRSRCLATSPPFSDNAAEAKRVYVIAGEASGDAIGAKVIAALQRQRNERIVFRGVGGPQMTTRGGFASLFPMEELSVMGLVEVLPSVLRLRRRFAETLDDIRAFRPHVVLTIDSKGFTFRVQRALASDPTLRDTVKRMHYVAPSVWAYKHRQRKTDYRDLRELLDKMFVILPFEKAIFTGVDGSGAASEWCQFVGHPAVEDFLELHGVYDKDPQASLAEPEGGDAALEISPGGLLERVQLDDQAISRRGKLMSTLMQRGRDDVDARAAFRVGRGLPSDAFLVCALVGSRENEVRRTIRMVLKAVDALQRPSEQVVKTTLGIPMKLAPLSSYGCVVRRPVHVIFPTIRAVEAIVRQEIESFCENSGAPADHFQIVIDADSCARHELFQCADVAVAVSGTIVTETALAALPTVVIYRANAVTEVLAKRLSAVRFVSIPNLLLGREEIPELLFRDCTAPTITQALRSIYRATRPLVAPPTPSQLAMALSTLTPWEESPSSKGRAAAPQRGSDLVADAIWRSMDK